MSNVPPTNSRPMSGSMPPPHLPSMAYPPPMADNMAMPYNFPIQPPPPSNPVPEQHQHPVMPPQRHTFTVKSLDAPVFVPRGFQTTANGLPDTSVPPPPLTSNQDPMTQLKQAIQALTSDPEYFDNTIGPLAQDLSCSVTDEATLIKIIEEIFSQSILVSNFRNTAAKMCNYLSYNLTKEFPQGNFRALLLKRCREEHARRETLAQNFDTRRQLIGFTVFLGELLLNLKDSNGKRIDVLGVAVHDLLLTILKDPTDENLRCVAQVLKLCGAALDEQKLPIMNEIMDQIKEVILLDSTKKSLRNLLVYVVELRASKWGSVNAQSSTIEASAPAPSFQSAPAAVAPQAAMSYPQQAMQPQAMYNMMYGGDNGQAGGMPYGADFGADDEYYDDYNPLAAGDDQSLGSDAYADSFYPYPELYSQDSSDMDDEIAAAFEDFIMQQNNG